MQSKVLSFFVNYHYSENKPATDIALPKLDEALAEGYQVKDIKHINFGDSSRVTVVIFTLTKD